MFSKRYVSKYMGFNIKGISKFILKGFKEHTLKTSDDHGYQRVRNLHITGIFRTVSKNKK